MIRPYLSLALSLLALLLWEGCFVVDKPFSKIPPGPWRGILYLESSQKADQVDEEGALNKDFKFEEVTAGELPFNFEVIYTDPEHFYLEIRNGEEKIRVDSILYGLDRRIAKDTMQFHFPEYDTYIKATFEEGFLAGEWIVNTKKDYRIKFRATFGKDYRFTELKKAPLRNISGSWKTTFGVGEEKPYPAIGEFKQEGNHLSGTFRTETGDFRYLEGTVQADKFYLSCFDGSHAYLFEGKMMPDSSLTGIFRGGSHYKGIWEARKDTAASLADPGAISHASRPGEPVHFSFLSSEGQMTSLNDPAFEGKGKIVQVMGTWCPNCLDETRYFLDYFKQNPGQEVAVIGLAFEKYPDTSQVLDHLSRFKTRLGIPWPILYAGKAGSKEASAALPFVDRIASFPTTFFLDRSNRIVYIHSGYDGPATSAFPAYQRKFDALVRQIQEK